MKKCKGVDGISRQKEINIFNNFIDENILMDLSLIGRIVTWSRLDGACMNRLDCISMGIGERFVGSLSYYVV